MSSVTRAFFGQAINTSGDEALFQWRCCLEAGDSMAHFALGYTLYGLGRYHESYRHLRYHAQIAPRWRLELVLAGQGDRGDRGGAGGLREGVRD